MLFKHGEAGLRSQGLAIAPHGEACSKPEVPHSCYETKQKMVSAVKRAFLSCMSPAQPNTDLM